MWTASTIAACCWAISFIAREKFSKHNLVSACTLCGVVQIGLTYFYLAGRFPWRCHQYSKWRWNLRSLRSRRPRTHLLGSEERSHSPRSPGHEGGHLSILSSTRQEKATCCSLHDPRGNEFPSTLSAVPTSYKLLYYRLVWQVAPGCFAVRSCFVSWSIRPGKKSRIQQHFDGKRV